MMHIHGRRAGGGAPADDRASCLFDLMSFITHISCVGPVAFCRFLHLIALPWRTTPHACGSWLWGRLGFLDAKVFIHFFSCRVNLPGWETICGC